jgi:CIC family chloride channel protein
MKNLISNITNLRSKYLNDTQFLSIVSVLVGITAGVVAALIKNAVHGIQLLLKMETIQTLQHYAYFAYPLFGILLAVLFARYIIRNGIGHGIPSVLYSISEDKGRIKKHNMFSSIISSAFTVGFGGSVGLEGPTVATGAAYGSYYGGLFHLSYKHRVILLGAASAGAMAAIFKAPITAIVFAVEVIMIDLTATSLIPLLLASIAAVLTSYYIMGPDVLYHFELKEIYKMSDMPLFALLGIVTGLVSIYFTKVYIYIQEFFDKQKSWLNRLLMGGLTLGALIFLFPALYGEGYEVINEALSGNYTYVQEFSFFNQLQGTHYLIILLVLVILFKVIATSVTFGAGGVGGIFAPTLFIGANTGLVFALGAQLLGYEVTVANFVLVAMAGAISGNLHAPLTAIFLIAEITGGYQLFVPLMLVATISYLTTRTFAKNSVYTVQLARRGHLMTHHTDKNIIKLLDLKDLIETNFTPVHIDQNLGDLVKAITNSDRNVFPVLDDENQLKGVVTMPDVRKIIFKPELYEKTKIKDLMFIPDIIIEANEQMSEIVQKFKNTGIYNLPVVDNGTYIGFISRANIFSAYRKLLQDFSTD